MAGVLGFGPTKLAIIVVVTLLGWPDFLTGKTPITLLAGAVGVWLFYVQRQLEHTNWTRDSLDAAQKGGAKQLGA